MTPKNKFTIFLLINHNMYLKTTAHNQNGYDYAIFDNCVKLMSVRDNTNGHFGKFTYFLYELDRLYANFAVFYET